MPTTIHPPLFAWRNSFKAALTVHPRSLASRHVSRPRRPAASKAAYSVIVAPRPIGLTNTQSAAGAVNLAPFSHFYLVSTSPPVLISSGDASGNRHERKRSPTCAPPANSSPIWTTWKLRDAMNMSSLNAPAGVDEFELGDLNLGTNWGTRSQRRSSRR